ncbi:MAG TPA: hypothetical protein VKV26_24695 [Dehalococcoidia bacterium]|nr:hypothetical protein [Dehalococcoidia bacterium]
MRALVIGFPLPSPQIDNYNLLTAPSWFDYDGVLVEPLSVSQVIEDVLEQREEHQTRAEEPIVNRPTGPLAVSLAEMIKRRRAEAQFLLQNGGVIAVFARPNVLHEGVAGFAGCDRYAWLPAPAAVAWEPPFLLRAEGSDVHITDPLHPFARFVEANARWIAYHARFDENTPGFPSFGHVFARSAGGAAVGVELRVGNGKVVFLPALGSIAYGDPRFEMATQMLEALRRASLKDGAQEEPGWAREIPLPGVEELETKAQAASAALHAAEGSLGEAMVELEKVAKYRALLWQEGALGLEPVVRDAFRTLGFEVEDDPDKPGWIADGSLKAFFEVQGSSGPAPEYPYFRLQKRLEKDLLDTREPKRGLIVINGFREQRPEMREAQASETLRIACENYRYALLTTERLLEMVRCVLDEPLDAVRRSMLRERLLKATGEVGPEVIPTAAELA